MGGSHIGICTWYVPGCLKSVDEAVGFLRKGTWNSEELPEHWEAGPSEEALVDAFHYGWSLEQIRDCLEEVLDFTFENPPEGVLCRSATVADKHIHILWCSHFSWGDAPCDWADAFWQLEAITVTTASGLEMPLTEWLGFM